MKVEYLTPKHPSRLETMSRILETHQHKAAIFTRLKGEVIAIVPSDNNTGERVWVWLSSHEDGAYCDGQARPVSEVVGTLARGDWVHQPDARIQVIGG